MTPAPLVVVESTAGSADLPRRALAQLDGVPLLEFQLRRLLPLTSHTDACLVLATSDLPVDDPVVELAERLGIGVVRGTQDDVLGRFSIALVRHGGDAIVRLADDAPLSDPFLIMAVLGLHHETGADHTSNLLPRSFPRGLEVEVLSARALRLAEIEAVDPEDRRRVTSFILRRPERFRLANLHSGHDLAAESWNVETHADLDHVQSLVAQVPDAASASWSHVLSVVGRHNRARPGQLVLAPGPSPAAGSPTWERTWDAVVDGASVGTAVVRVHEGRVEREVNVAEPWLEPAREALYRLLLDDPQVGR